MCAVALYDDDQLLGASRISTDRAHSKSLASMVKSTIDSCNVNKADLSAVAISQGPGSYTGLRIGTSFAKGVCFSLNIPLIGIDTLDGMIETLPAKDPEALFCPMIDARRMEVYCKVTDSDGGLVTELQPKIIDETSFQELLNENKLFLFGDGALKCEPVIKHKNIFYRKDFEMSAKGVGSLAFRKFAKNEFEDLAYFEPFYLKEYKAGKPKPLIVT